MDEFVSVPRVAFDWLMGEAPDAEGRWFDPSAFGNRRGSYWWRSVFHKMIEEAAPAPQAVTDEMVERSARAIFEHWQYAARRSWAENGNSIFQNRARDFARVALTALKDTK